MTDDLFPEPPKTTNYPPSFEACWKVHPVGVKKKAYQAGVSAGFTDRNWLWLERHLEQRHREDAQWVKGTYDRVTGEVKRYIPHLTTYINKERWTDEYVRVKPKPAVQLVQEGPTAEGTARAEADYQRNKDTLRALRGIRE